MIRTLVFFIIQNRRSIVKSIFSKKQENRKLSAKKYGFYEH